LQDEINRKNAESKAEIHLAIKEILTKPIVEIKTTPYIGVQRIRVDPRFHHESQGSKKDTEVQFRQKKEESEKEEI
jgi:hypothetical protein